MRYDQIVESFKSDEGIAQLLNKLRDECFDVVEAYREQLLNEAITTTDELQRAKTVLTTITSYLQPIYSKALSLKKQYEYRYCVEHKEDGSAAYVDKAAKSEVQRYRDTRDIICGYLKSTEALIYDCMDKIEQNRREYHNTEK